MVKRRIFHRKKYHNPFFSKKASSQVISSSARRKKIRLPKLVYLVIALVGLFVLSYADAFQITEVGVTGTQRLDPDAIKQVILDQAASRRWIVFKQGSIFFFNKSQAANSIHEQFLIEKVKVKKRYFNTIKVEVTEKASGIAWVSSGQQHYLDLSGVALHELELGQGIVIQSTQDNTDVIRSEISSGGLPVVYDLSNATVAVAQQVTTDQLVYFVLTLFEELSVVADFEIAKFNIERPFSREVTLVTKEGWEARFSIDEDPVTQSGILMSILEQKIKERDSLEYIDLRFGERVFYQ